MDDLIVLLFLIVVFGGVAILKFLAKILGGVQSGGTPGAAVKKTKSLFEMLTDGNLEEFVKKLSGEEEEEKEEEPATEWSEPFRPPRRDERDQPAARTAAPDAWAIESRESPAERRPRPVAAAAPVWREPQRRRQRPPAAEVPPAQPVRPRLVRPRVAEEPEEWRQRRRPAGGVQLRLGDCQALREAILLREVLGPPKAFQMRPRPGMPGSFGPAIPPRPAPVQAAAPPVREEPMPAAPREPAPDVPSHVADMYSMGMITREQFDELCEFFARRQRGET